MIDVATRIALAPLLYRQAVRLKRVALELPEPDGARHGVEGAGAPLGLIVLGDSSAAGVGAATQDEALARPLAQALAQACQRQVRWQLLAQTGLTSAGLLQLLRDSKVQPATVAVVVCGVNDITKEEGLQRALRHREHIADWLRIHRGVRRVFFPALPEMECFPALPQPLAFYAGQAARRNNRAQARWAAQLAHVEHVPMQGVARRELFCSDGFHPAPALYQRVAQRLARVMAERAMQNNFWQEMR